jgi:hypothetical protein
MPLPLSVGASLLSLPGSVKVWGTPEQTSKNMMSADCGRETSGRNSALVRRKSFPHKGGAGNATLGLLRCLYFRTRVAGKGVSCATSAKDQLQRAASR